MRYFGLLPEDYPENDYKILPENWTSWRVFLAMITQWRWTNGVRVGMDYSALTEVWGLLRIPKKDRSQIFDDLRVMENAALEEMRKK